MYEHLREANHYGEIEKLFTRLLFDYMTRYDTNTYNSILKLWAEVRVSIRFDFMQVDSIKELWENIIAPYEDRRLFVAAMSSAMTLRLGASEWLKLREDIGTSLSDLKTNSLSSLKPQHNSQAKNAGQVDDVFFQSLTDRDIVGHMKLNPWLAVLYLLSNVGDIEIYEMNKNINAVENRRKSLLRGDDNEAGGAS